VRDNVGTWSGSERVLGGLGLVCVEAFFDCKRTGFDACTMIWALRSGLSLIELGQ